MGHRVTCLADELLTKALRIDCRETRVVNLQEASMNESFSRSRHCEIQLNKSDRCTPLKAKTANVVIDKRLAGVDARKPYTFEQMPAAANGKPLALLLTPHFTIFFLSYPPCTSLTLC